MKRCAAVLAVLSLVASATPAGARERRVLVVSEARGFVHDSIPAAVAYLRELGRRSRRYHVATLRQGAAGLTPARLRRADAVVFANTSGELPLPSRAALRRFVRAGGGLVGTHSASDTFYSWPRFAPLLGARFQRHGAPAEGRLLVEGPRHPATDGLPRAFRLTEEFYEFTSSPRARARVLLRLDPRSVGDELRPDIPLVWCRREGSGRVFYDALGHFPRTWSDRRHRLIVAGGLRWALGLHPRSRC